MSRRQGGRERKEGTAVRFKTILVTAALALAGVIAVMAYTQATVNGSAAAAVVTTEDALLALSCSDGAVNADGTCYVEGGGLFLDFSKGIGDRGFQPNSVYEFTDLVVVTNNSTGDVDVSLAAEGDLFTTAGLTVEVTMNPDAPATLAGSGGTATISFKFTAAGDVALSGLTGTLQVTATRGGAGD